MRLIFITISVLALAACGANRLTYTAAPIEGQEAAIAVIDRMLREQPFENTPEEVFVDSKSFRTINHQERRSFITGGVTTTPVGQAVYYDNVSGIELWKKRSLYIVMLLDSRRVVLYRMHTIDLDRAKKFVDAVNFMRDANTLPNEPKTVHL